MSVVVKRNRNDIRDRVGESQRQKRKDEKEMEEILYSLAPQTKPILIECHS